MYLWEGEAGDSLYIVKQSNISMLKPGRQVLVVTPIFFCGEHMLLLGLKQNCMVMCSSCLSSSSLPFSNCGGCATSHILGHNFCKLMETSPYAKKALGNTMNWHNFKKLWCQALDTTSYTIISARGLTPLHPFSKSGLLLHLCKKTLVFSLSQIWGNSLFHELLSFFIQNWRSKVDCFIFCRLGMKFFCSN